MLADVNPIKQVRLLPGKGITGLKTFSNLNHINYCLSVNALVLYQDIYSWSVSNLVYNHQEIVLLENIVIFSSQ